MTSSGQIHYLMKTCQERSQGSINTAVRNDRGQVNENYYGWALSTICPPDFIAGA